MRVEGGSQTGITYVIRSQSFTSSEQDARRQFDAYKVNAYAKRDTAWIVADWQGSRPRKFSGEFVIKVPRSMEWVKVETDGGAVSASAITGRVDTVSGGGSIRLDDIGGQINAETGGGSIDVGTVGGEITLRTGGGSIKVASAKGKITAESGGGSVVVLSGMQGATLETGGGSIQVDRCNGQVRASTGGGSIDLGDVGGSADLETGGGSIRLTSAKGPVRATTGGGSIELGGVPSARAESGGGGIVAKFLTGGDRTDSTLETSAGDITVYLASDLNVTVRAAIELANGHKIRSDFSDIQIHSEGGRVGAEDGDSGRQLEWRRANTEGADQQRRHCVSSREQVKAAKPSSRVKRVKRSAVERSEFERSEVERSDVEPGRNPMRKAMLMSAVLVPAARARSLRRAVV